MTRTLLIAAVGVFLAAGCTPPPEPPPRREPGPTIPTLETLQPAPNEGVLMFRGSPHRDLHGVGELPREPVEVLWRHPVGCSREWCGVGWTGQPLLVDWSDWSRSLQPFFAPGGPDVEVVVGGLDGRVYFLDLATGEASRPLLRAQTASIKGTPTIDPRGAPLLYVGQGLPGHDGDWHYKAFSLIGPTLLMDISGRDRTYEGEPLGPSRSWGAFDGNGVVLADQDRFALGGENGLVYRVDLHTDWEGQRLGLAPESHPATYHTVRPKYGDADTRDDTSRWCAGIESSMAVHDNVGYFADSIGSLTGMALDTGEVVLQLDLGDDTDASPVIAIEDDRPYLYVGAEVDRQVHCRPCYATGTLRFHKVDLEAKAFAWTLEVPARTCKRADKRHDFNGGVLGTAAMGSGPSAHLVFVPTAHEPGLDQGRLLAVRRQPDDDGNPVIEWAAELHGAAWSSPSTDGRTIIAPDSEGWVHAFDTVTGELLWEIQLEGAVESTTVFWDGKIVAGARGGAVVCLGVSEEPPPAP